MHTVLSKGYTAQEVTWRRWSTALLTHQTE